jgi:hypothetical protein
MHSCVLDLFSDRCPVSVFAQARGRGEREVFKLAKHDYLHIVVLMGIIVKTSLRGRSQASCRHPGDLRFIVYNTAERDAMLPRKPMPHPELEEQLAKPLEGIYPGAAVTGVCFEDRCQRPARIVSVTRAASSAAFTSCVRKICTPLRIKAV